MINFHSELVAICILSCNPKETVKNAMLLSITSKVFHSIINSEEFFKVLVLLAGSGYLLPNLTNDQNCFKNRYFELRGLCLKKTEKLPGAVFGDALVSVEGVELFSFSDKICNFKLEENPLFNSIAIPENIRINLNVSQDTPFAFRSNDYLAIHDGRNRSVYVCTLSEEKWTRYDLLGNVCQLHIDGNQLFVVEGGGRFYNLLVFNLEVDSYQNPITIELTEACFPPVFGKDYILYINQTCYNLQPFALALSCLRESAIDMQALPWQAGLAITGVLKYFPYGNDFIEVLYDEDIIVAKINISKEGFLREVIARDITRDIPEDVKTTISDICYHDERLFIAYGLPDLGTKIFSCDLLTKKIDEVLFIPKHTEIIDFKARFLCAAEKVYHLSMELVEEDVKSHLTMLKFGKI